jgi:CelD/BcsL family acetyltransferase involved in cellulose biosynthesis
MAAEIQVDELTTFKAVKAIQGDWEEVLLASGGSVFSSPQWLLPWWQHCGAAWQPWILRLHHGGRTTGLALFMLRETRRAGLTLRRAEFLGGGLSDRHDLLLAGDLEAQGAAFLRALQVARWDLLDLREVPEDSWLATGFPSGATAAGLCVDRLPDSRCPVLELQGDWEAFESARFTAKVRANWRRRERNLWASGPVSLEILREPEAICARFDTIVKLEQEQSNKAGPGRGLFSDASHVPFLREALTELSARGQVALVTLSLADRLVAYLIGLLSGGEFLNYNTAYDRSLASAGIGVAVLRAAVQEAFRGKARVFDFLRGDETYKFEWTEQVRRQVRLVVTRRSLRGRLIRWRFFQRQSLPTEAGSSDRGSIPS